MIAPTPFNPIPVPPSDPQTALNNSVQDSINLINSYMEALPEGMTEEQRRNDILRNAEHLTTLLKQNLIQPGNIATARHAASTGENWVKTRLD